MKYYNSTCQVLVQYQLCKKAIKIFSNFPTTYICEAGFSLYSSMKTAYQNRLKAEAEMRTQISYTVRHLKK